MVAGAAGRQQHREAADAGSVDKPDRAQRDQPGHAATPPDVPGPPVGRQALAASSTVQCGPDANSQVRAGADLRQQPPHARRKRCPGQDAHGALHQVSARLARSRAAGGTRQPRPGSGYTRQRPPPGTAWTRTGLTAAGHRDASGNPGAGVLRLPVGRIRRSRPHPKVRRRPGRKRGREVLRRPVAGRAPRSRRRAAEGATRTVPIGRRLHVRELVEQQASSPAAVPRARRRAA